MTTTEQTPTTRERLDALLLRTRNAQAAGDADELGQIVREIADLVVEQLATSHTTDEPGIEYGVAGEHRHRASPAAAAELVHTHPVNGQTSTHRHACATGWTRTARGI